MLSQCVCHKLGQALAGLLPIGALLIPIFTYLANNNQQIAGEIFCMNVSFNQCVSAKQALLHSLAVYGVLI